MKALICGGGTVGHITPGISIAEIIKKHEPKSEITFIGRENGEENRVITKKGYKLRTISVKGLLRNASIKNLKAIYKLFGSLKASKEILKEEAPDIVIGTGGYVCWPVIKAAQKMKIPTVIHESNLSPGLATKALSKKCDKILLNFKESEEMFRKKDNVIPVGNPISDVFFTASRKSARERLNLSDSDFLILSFGGSGGSKKLNEEILKFMKSFSAKNKRIKHIHATGRKYFSETKSNYPNFLDGNNGCKILPFIDDMPHYMKAADIIISRCGAMTLSEISASGCVPILIPSPNVTNNHQYKNAKTFTDCGAAIMIEESELNETTLTDAVKFLLSNKSTREQMKKNLSSFKNENAGEKIYGIIKSLISR